jgi:hypothetical protein
VAAPLLWCAFDLVTTGAPFHSLTTTQDLAGTLQRERGLESAITDTPLNLKVILGAEVAWLGIAMGVVALVLAEERALVALATLGTGLVGFLVLGIANLPLLTRYLLVPSAVLALFCAAAVGAFEWLPPGRLRLAGWAMAGIAAAVLATGFGAVREGVDFNTQRVAGDRQMRDALLSVADVAASRGLSRCAPIQTATHRAIPILAYKLGRRPSGIHVVLPARARAGLVFAAAPEAIVGDVDLLPGVTIHSQDLVPPKTFQRLAGNRWWTLAARC